MKYTVKVEGEAALDLPEQDFKFEAKDGDEACNAVREKLSKLVSKFGGELAVVVACEETWTRVSPTPRGGTTTETIPPGEVSSFSFAVEPHESVRLQAAARKVDRELAALTEGAFVGDTTERTIRRTEALSDWLLSGVINAEQFRAAVRSPDKSLESVVDEAVAAEKAVTQ
jgi:hypothetical protein